MLPWTALALLAGAPMAYFGVELGWASLEILLVLTWGLCICGIAVEIDRRRR